MGKVVLVFGLLLSACGNTSCDLIGSDRLRDECENGIMIKVYSVPTWMPGHTYRELLDANPRSGDLY